MRLQAPRTAAAAAAADVAAVLAVPGFEVEHKLTNKRMTGNPFLAWQRNLEQLGTEADLWLAARIDCQRAVGAAVAVIAGLVVATVRRHAVLTWHCVVRLPAFMVTAQSAAGREQLPARQQRLPRPPAHTQGLDGGSMLSRGLPIWAQDQFEAGGWPVAWGKCMPAHPSKVCSSSDASPGVPCRRVRLLVAGCFRGSHALRAVAQAHLVSRCVGSWVYAGHA